MASRNLVILIGRTGKDAELQYTPSGKAVTKFSLATSETWTTNGEKQEKTTWHNIVIWGKPAENAAKYLTKGKQVYIEGKIDNRSYEDKDGNKRYISEVIASNFTMLGSTQARDDGDGGYEKPDLQDQQNISGNPEFDDVPF